jgi:UDP-N-acetylmuramoyl-tripeptide--D-alanyl-D-alanine ligase
MFSFLSSLWAIRTTKAILFWLYLWQLKEYHLGRFLAHFQTEKGKGLFLNKNFVFKIILLFLFFRLPLLVFFLLIILYILESVKAIFDVFRGRIKKPVLTKKTLFLILAGLAVEILIILFLSKYYQLILFATLGFLIFDIITPLIVSAIVLFFQPLAVLGRSRIIKKAKEKRAEFKKLLVIGITGSYGKTSTKEFLYTILSEKFGEERILKTKEHQNSEVGISQCILNDLKPEHQIFICEMGAYNRGGIKLLSDIAKPQIGILTGINEQHLATFGSLDNIIKTKYELIESLPRLGFAVFNGDNEYCRELHKKAPVSKRICYTTFSASAHEVVGGDFWTSKIEADKESVYFKVFSRWGEIGEFKVRVPGQHYAQNILMAAVVAKEVLGMTLDEIMKVAQKIKPEQGGMKLIKTKDGLNIIDSTYSANPDGVISHLEYLKLWSGRKVIIMPCLIELGQASGEIHRKIGEEIAGVCDLAIITTKDRFREIQEKAGEKAVFLENPKKIFEKIKKFCSPGDIVLLESRVPSQLIEKLTI